MPIKLPDWVRPTPKGVAENALASMLLDVVQRLLLAVLGMVIPTGALVKIFTAPPTDRDWFWWTLYACVLFAMTWGGIDFARTQRAARRNSLVSTTVGAPSKPLPTEAAADEFAHVTFETSKPSPQHDFFVTATLQIRRQMKDAVVFARSGRREASRAKEKLSIPSVRWQSNIIAA